MKHTKIFFWSLMVLSLSLSSCSPTIIVRDNEARWDPAVRNGQQTERKINDIALNGKVYSALWQQNAGEFRALCYQAYNLATQIVKEKSSMQHLRPIAIITDIDETFLDNSPYAVTQAQLGNEFSPDTWLEWTSKGEAVAFPGSVEFFNYAASRNVTVFYITNRNEADKPGTIKNLKKLGFPFADEDHVMVMSDTSNKEKRRQEVLKEYEVFMYLGDNLTDFSEVFYKTSQLERNQSVDDMAELFGKKFIVLPNSGYGDWESALPGYQSKESVEHKDKAILNNVVGY